MNKSLLAATLLGAIFSLLSGCFDRDNDHPAKDPDPIKPSLQMQQSGPPATHSSSEAKPQNQ